MDSRKKANAKYRKSEKRRETVKRWKLANPEKIRAYKKRDYEKNKDKINAKSREWYLKNRESEKEKKRIAYHADREAIRAKSRSWRAQNREIVKRWRDEHRKKNRAAYVLFGTKKKCKNDRLEFNLTVEWLEERLRAGVCEMSGLPFDMEGKRGPMCPSIDRRDPNGGYTMDNCRVILWFLNRAMSNLGEEYCLDVFGRVLARRQTLRAV